MSAFVPEPTDGAPVPETTTDDEPPSAAQRLANSRERLREWMTQGGGRHDARRRADAAVAAGEKPAWMDRLRTAPIVGVVLDAAQAWWSNHPLHPAAHLAQGVVSERIAPLARRHPVAIVLGAFLVGVALVRWRPWRLLAKSALFAGLGSQIITRVIASIPLESIVEAFGGFGPRRPPETDGDPQAPPSGTAAAPAGPPVSAAAVEAQTVTP
jgi:hypothetical protein